MAQKEKSIALVNKIFPNYSPQKIEAIDTISKTYQPIIDSLIARDANFSNGSQIDVAIRLATELNLTTTQLEQLTKVQYELNEKKLQLKNEKPEAEYDSKSFESEVLNKLLTEEQYTSVLVAKYSNTAANQTKQDWGQIIKNNLTNDFPDSVATKLELTNYHTAILVAYYRNAFDKEKQYESVKRIQEIMPDALRVLIDKWNYKTPYSDTPDTFFQW